MPPERFKHKSTHAPCTNDEVYSGRRKTGEIITGEDTENTSLAEFNVEASICHVYKWT